MASGSVRVVDAPRATGSGPRGIIAFDLDGTVFAHRFDSMVSSRVASAFSAAHELGYELAVSTGRPLFELSGELLGAPWLNWAICSSGATLYRVKPQTMCADFSLTGDISDFLNVTPIESRRLAFEHVQEIVKLTSPYVASYWVDTPEGYFVEDTKIPERLRLLPFTIQTHVDSIVEVPEVRRVGAYKICVCFERSEDRIKVQSDLGNLSSVPYEVANEGDNSLEFSPLGVSKGVAALSVCRMTGALPEASIAFGDSGNDISFAKTPIRFVVMNSAEPKVLASADDICPDVFHDGVAIWLEQHILSNS